MTIEEIIDERKKVERLIEKILTDFNLKILNENVYVRSIDIIQGMSAPVRHISIHLSVK